MSTLLHISGPSFNREVAIGVETGLMTIGREAGVGVTLPDPDKAVSRRHLTVRAVVDGVELQVISKVNGIDTSRGAVAPGQNIALSAGDSFQLGPYHFRVEGQAGDGASMSAAPIAEAAGRRAAGSPGRPEAGDDSVFAFLNDAAPALARAGDPFSQPAFHAAPAPRTADDPFDVLSTLDDRSLPPRRGQPVGNASPRSGPFGPPAVGRPVDRPRHDGPPRLVDDWIRDEAPDAGALARNGPLDAMLDRGAPPPRALAPDHVHGIHLPLQGHGAARLPATPGATPSLPVPVSFTPASSPPASFTSPPLTPAPLAPDHAGSVATPAAADAEFPSLRWESLVQGPGADTAAKAADRSAPLNGMAPNAGATAPMAAPRPVASAAAAAPKAVADAGTPIPIPLSVPIPTPPPPPADPLWLAFARGLQWSAERTDEAAAERAGAMVRVVIEGLSELLRVRAELKRELRDPDRTVLSIRDNNPLKYNLTPDELVRYLFAPEASAGYMPADRAIRESVADLRIHQHAAIAAARAALAGALQDFEPGRLKQSLAVKSAWFETLQRAALWSAYEQNYQHKAQNTADWLEEMFKRHFMPAYLREIEQLKQAGD